jgi:hypothetical protein
MKPNLAPLLNIEILRIAKEENRTDEKQMKAFMLEIARLCAVGRRQVYHWRSGRHPLPAEHVPTLCERFGSRVLLDALVSAATETVVEVPDSFDLAVHASRLVREDLAVYEELLLDFESDGIQPGELVRLRELCARVHRNIHLALDIAEADCARRLAAEAPPRKGSVTSEKKDSQITGMAERTATGGSLSRR